MNENKHRPDRIEVMGPQLVEVECACGWQVATTAWDRAAPLLEGHVSQANTELLNKVARQLFEVAHPTAFSYADQPESTIKTYTQLAEHVLERGYDA